MNSLRDLYRNNDVIVRSKYSQVWLSKQTDGERWCARNVSVGCICLAAYICVVHRRKEVG